MTSKSLSIRLFDNYEISGCKRFRDKKGGTYIEAVEENEATFWTLYGHTEGEGVIAIGDFKTRDFAEEIYFRIVGRPFTSSYKAEEELVKARYVLTSASLPAKVRDAIERVIEYNWRDEQRHFWETPRRMRKGHIFCSLRTLRAWLEGGAMTP